MNNDMHTPGPWYSGKTIQARPPGREYPADAFAVAQRVNRPADARLIAAAPDLLEALKNLAFAAETVAHLRGLEKELLPFTDAARAAITRATTPTT